MKDIRVKRSGDKEEVLESLKDNIFGQLTNALIFAASVGFKNGERIPLSSKGAGDPIKEDVFRRTNLHWRGILNMMALCESNGDMSSLEDSDEKEEDRIRIFEEYANGGLKILHDKLSRSSIPELKKFILEEMTEDTEPLDTNFKI